MCPVVGPELVQDILHAALDRFFRNRELRGDLDNIVLKAMRKEPERRYQSAAQFSEDIRRYSEGLPIIARNDCVGAIGVSGVQSSQDEQIAQAVEDNARIRTTDDFREGVTSFLEKRKPKWSG